jgi:hypothetical protein
MSFAPFEKLGEQQSNSVATDNTGRHNAHQDEGKRLLEKCDRTFESFGKIVALLKEADPKELPEIVQRIDIDFELIQAVIRDYYKK